MEKIDFISARVEERDICHNFTKNDFVGEWPGYPKLDYDPFPGKSLDDIVCTEIVGRELVLRGKIRGDIVDLAPNTPISYDGRKFFLSFMSLDLDVLGDNHTAEIEATHLLTPLDISTRLQHLAFLRASYSANVSEATPVRTPTTPHLAAVFIHPKNVFNNRHVRDFAPEEVEECKCMISDYIKIREKYSLLHILAFNFARVGAFVRNIKALDPYPQMVEANSHFMNYLSTGYALREHLKTALAKDFGNNSVQFRKLKELLHLMEQRSFDYAFLQDFRNFVQHCGFPIGRMIFTKERTFCHLTICYSRKELLAKYAKWNKCGLASRGETDLDLRTIVERAHQLSVQEFSSFIYAMYSQSISRMDGYFRRLQSEAKAVHPAAQARLLLSSHSTPLGGKFEMQHIPDDIFAELGLLKPK